MTDAGDDRQRAALRFAVAGATLVFIVLGTIHALTIPPYEPSDEPTHIGYILVLRDGVLPTIDTPIPRGWSDDLDAMVAHNVANFGAYRGDVLVANHPPLFYLLAQGPVAIGERLGTPEDGLRLARVLSVLLASGGVVATGVLASVLVPGRPQVTIAAAWFTALLPLNVHVSAYLYTDGLAVATFIAALAAAAVLVRRGWSVQRLVVAAALGGLAGASRASGLAATGAVGLAALIAAVRAGGPTAARVRRALAGGSFVALAFLTLAGWFFVRNVVLYGDPTGGATLLPKVGREAPEPFLAPLRNLHAWRLWLGDYWEGFARGVKPLHEAGLRPVPWAVMATLIVGGVMRAGGALARGARPSTETLLTWLPPVAACVVLFVSILDFIASGGLIHPRYALPMLGVGGTLVGLCLTGFPGHRRGWPTVVLVGIMLGVNTLALSRFLLLTPPWREIATGPWDAVHIALAGVGVPASAALLAAGVLLSAGIGGLIFALRLLATPATAVAVERDAPV